MNHTSLLVIAMLLLSPCLFAQAAEPQARTFDVQAFDFGFRVTPPEFFVNQGDSVTLRLTASEGNHGFGLEHYAEGSVDLFEEPITIHFVADKAGLFHFACTQSFCGFGHFEMNGVFEVLGPDTKPFTITGFEPETGPSAGEDLVTIHGTGFVKGVRVFFGSAAAEPVFFINETTIFAGTPPHSGGSVPVTVRLESGRGATSSRSFLYVAPLSIGVLSPVRGHPAGGTKVVIHGSGFTAGAPVDVRFGGVAATSLQVLDSETILATAPAHAAGIVDVIVTVGGTSTTGAAFTYSNTVKRRSVR